MKVSIVHERGDDLVATAARASFNRRADQYTEEQNKGLLRFLVRPAIPHWAPYAHVRITLDMPHWSIIYKKLTHLDKTGMKEIRKADGIVTVSHSLWGWYNLIRSRKIHFNTVDSVIDHLIDEAPNCAEVLDLEKYRATDLAVKDRVTVERSGWHYETDFITLRVEMPITIARQFMKCVAGYAYSEASGRYITYSKIYMPTELHGQPDNKKQGSGKVLGFVRNMLAKAVIKASYAVSKLAYNLLHHVLGVAAEEARCVMPLYTGTVLVVTAARDDWDRFLHLRLANDAQTDVRVIARLAEEQLNA